MDVGHLMYDSYVLQADGKTLDCFFNPTHADPSGPDRGLRLSVPLKGGNTVAGSSSVSLMAVNAAAKFDYVGVYTDEKIASMLP